MTLAPALSALAWTLIHSLWQGAVIAALVALAARRSGRSELRYALYFGGAAASLAAAIITYLIVYPWAVKGGATQTAMLAMMLVEDGGRALLGGGPRLTEAGASGDRWLAGVLLGWSVGATLRTARVMVGLAAIARMRRRSAPLYGAWEAALDRLRGRLGVTRKVGLAESGGVDSPMVLGALRPLILLPIGMLHRLSPESVEAALLHELMHVRRHDYLMGLGLALVEALLFFHPAIWWLSRRAREEREHCCDDGVVRHTGDPLRYAMALTDLEALRGEITAPPTPMLGQSAAGGELMSRIQRLIDHAGPATPSKARAAGRARTSNLWMPAFTLSAAIAVAVVVAPACMEAEMDEENVAAGALERELLAEEPSVPAEAPAKGLAAPPEAKAGDAAGEQDLSIAWLPERLDPFTPEIRAAAERHGVDPELIAIVTLLESGGDPTARSPHGARGLMQLMPTTAEKIAARRGLEGHAEERLDDPAYNLDLGASHLAELIADFAGDDGELSPESVELVAAAYNGGAKRVRAYMAGEAELSAETARYKGLVRGLWSERAQPASSTLDAMRSR